MRNNVGWALVFLLGMGCVHRQDLPAPTVASHVELSRFMGDWHVIASIPVWIEKDSCNGVESYRLDEKQRIQTTYTFRKGGFSGPLKTYRPVAIVFNKETNRLF